MSSATSVAPRSSFFPHRTGANIDGPEFLQFAFESPGGGLAGQGVGAGVVDPDVDARREQPPGRFDQAIAFFGLGEIVQ